MEFKSKYAYGIWEVLYTVYIPDHLTLNADYLRKFGTRGTGVRQIDANLASATILVKIPIIKILEYYDNGITVQIPQRSDMLAIHRGIEDYLQEWRDHIEYGINTNAQNNKQLLLGLEKLSRHIYDKAEAKEVVSRLFKKNDFGIMNPIAIKDNAVKEEDKPLYNSISKLLRR